VTLGSTQHLTEISTRSISWGKGDRCVRLTNYHHPVLLSRNSWNPSGPVQASNGTALSFYLLLVWTKCSFPLSFFNQNFTSYTFFPYCVFVPPVLRFSSINMRKPIINLSIIQINVAPTKCMLDNSSASPI